MRRDRWAFTALLREATRNAFSLRSRVYPVLLFAALASTAWPIVAAQQSMNLSATLDAESLAGRNVVRVTSSDAQNPAEIDIASCEGLAEQPDVEAAGAIVPLGSFDLPQLGSNIPVLGASTTLVHELDRARAVVGPSLRTTPTPDLFLAPDGTTLTATRGHPTASSIGTNNAVTVAISPTTQWVNACVILLDELADSSVVVERLTSSLVARGGALSAVQEFKSPTNPIDTYRNSLLGMLPFAVGLAGAAAGIGAMFARTSEWATYRLSGTSRRSLVVLITLEQLLCALVFSAGSAVATVIFAGLLVSPESTLFSAAAGSMMWVAVSLVGASLLALRSPITMARET